MIDKDFDPNVEYSKLTDIVNHTMYDNIAKTFEENLPYHSYRSVLDLGCGKGDIVSASDITGINYTGVDYSESMLSVAKETLKHRFDNKTFIQCKLPEVFDVVFNKPYKLIICSRFLQYIPSVKDRSILVKKMIDSLSPKGILLFSCYKLDDKESNNEGIVINNVTKSKLYYYKCIKEEVEVMFNSLNTLYISDKDDSKSIIYIGQK